MVEDHAGNVGRVRSERSERSPPQSPLSSRRIIIIWLSPFDDASNHRINKVIALFSILFTNFVEINHITMLEDFRLRVFMTVAQEKSFTKAANLLNISQPAVSQHISELERMAGVKLFERLHGEIRLTEQGSVFREHAARILQAYKSASSLFSPMVPALVRVNASDEVFACLKDAFAMFSQMHSEVEFLRSDESDSELCFELKPAPKTMGGISATHNIISTMYLLCKPSEAFAQTELFSSLRGFLSDTIS